MSVCESDGRLKSVCVCVCMPCGHSQFALLGFKSCLGGAERSGGGLLLK